MQPRFLRTVYLTAKQQRRSLFQLSSWSVRLSRTCPMGLQPCAQINVRTVRYSAL